MSEVVFEVRNTWTDISYADHKILKILDKESRYPTQAAQMMKWAPQQTGNGWDGWIRLMRFPKSGNPRFPSGLVPRLSRICRKYDYEPIIHDHRARPANGFPEFADGGQTIVDRDYQLEAAEAALRKGRGVLDMPPRSGKTRTMVEIHRRLGLPTLWLAPTAAIADQTARVLESFFGDHYVVRQTGSKNLEQAGRARVVVATAQTAVGLSEEFFRTREVLVVDEWHHGSSKTYSKGIFPKADHIYFRFGMTGTHFRSGEDELAMHAILSDVIYKVETPFLLERGYLVPARVVFLPMPSHPKVRGVGSSFVSGHGRHGIHVHKGRNQLVAHCAVELNRAGRRVLVLVGTKEQGYMIQRFMLPFFGDVVGRHKAVEFVSTDKARPEQKQILDSYLGGGDVQVLIGTSLLGEGVDLPQADALVYARGEKAEVSLRQNWFRVCTALGGKREAIIVDFADRHNGRLMKHSHQRLDAYYTEPIFRVEVLDDISDFVPWLSGVIRG